MGLQDALMRLEKLPGIIYLVTRHFCFSVSVVFCVARVPHREIYQKPFNDQTSNLQFFQIIEITETGNANAF